VRSAPGTRSSPATNNTKISLRGLETDGHKHALPIVPEEWRDY
jgi:hypothetical protein